MISWRNKNCYFAKIGSKFVVTIKKIKKSLISAHQSQNWWFALRSNGKSSEWGPAVQCASMYKLLYIFLKKQLFLFRGWPVWIPDEWGPRCPLERPSASPPHCRTARGTGSPCTDKDDNWTQFQIDHFRVAFCRVYRFNGFFVCRLYMLD